MDAFPVANKDLKGINWGSSRHPDIFQKRSTVFGTTLENHLEELKMEKPFTDLRVDSVYH